MMMPIVVLLGFPSFCATKVLEPKLSNCSFRPLKRPSLHSNITTFYREMSNLDTIYCETWEKRQPVLGD